MGLPGARGGSLFTMPFSKAASRGHICPDDGVGKGSYDNRNTHVCLLIASVVWLFVTPQTVARQAPLSMGISRQEYWSALPCPSPRVIARPGIKRAFLKSPALAGKFFITSAPWEAQWNVGAGLPHPYPELAVGSAHSVGSQLLYPAGGRCLLRQGSQNESRPLELGC